MLIDKYIEGFRQCCWINKKNRIVITGRGSIKPAATNDSFKLSTPVIRRWKTIIPAIILQKYKIERLHKEHFLHVKLIYHLADQRVLFGSFRIVSAWITKENRQGVWIMVLWNVTHCPRPAVWIFFVQLKNKKWDNETKSTLLMISKWRSTHGLRSISAVFSGSVFHPLKHGREHLLISWTAISNRAYLWPYNFGYQLIIKLIT